MKKRWILTGERIYVNPRKVIESGALVLGGERILWAGRSSELPGTYENLPRQEVSRGVVFPGFNDNHLHSAVYGDNETYPSLEGLGAQQIVAKLKEEFDGWPKGKPIMAFSWDYTDCPNPHRSILDEAFANNPVALIQFSGHGAWVNSVMLEELGIDRNTPDPEGGMILRDERGEPTGVLRDTAMNRIHQKRFVELHKDKKRLTAAIERALAHYRELGITSVQDNTWLPQTIGVLRKLKKSGRLTARFSCWPYGVVPWLAFITDLMRYDPPWFSRGPWKYFLDGTFSTKTAWLLEAYPGEPDNFGRPVLQGEALDKVLIRAARKGRQAAFHAIGDGAIHELLDRIEALVGSYPALRDLRIRIEHAQLVSPEDIRRIRELGVIVAAQPHAMGNPAKDELIVGADRAVSAYPHRSLLREGVPLSFGSDIPGEPTVNPFEAIHHVVNRRGAEALSVAEALSAYTEGSAYAQFMETEKGTLEPGRLADFVVLSEDPLQIPKGRIREILVLETYVGGRSVYRRSD
ncbi:MAG: amidohydrolase [Alkalispirochaetaceae bacterium]